MGSHERATDAALLHATRTDPTAFDTFYGRYERPLLAYFRARTRDPELTADLTAEVFAAALEHADRFDERRAAGKEAHGKAFAVPGVRPRTTGDVTLAGLVPDGVASVEVGAGGARVPVANNFFVATVREVAGGPLVRWLDADGKDITPGR